MAPVVLFDNLRILLGGGLGLRLIIENAVILRLGVSVAGTLLVLDGLDALDLLFAVRASVLKSTVSTKNKI